MWGSPGFTFAIAAAVPALPLPSRTGISMLAAMATDTQTYTAEIGGMKLHARSDEHGVRIGDGTDTAPISDGDRLRSFTGSIGEEEVPIYVEESEEDHEYIVYIRGQAVRVHLVTPRDERLLALRKNTRAGGSSGQIVSAPMPGFLKVMLVGEGDLVEKGSSLCILEAMKMENEIKAPGRLMVKRLIAQAGTAVEKGAPLIELGPVPEQ
jgi:biotin carboxyl carrier protein